MTYIILLLMKRFFSVQKLDSETIDKYHSGGESHHFLLNYKLRIHIACMTPMFSISSIRISRRLLTRHSTLSIHFAQMPMCIAALSKV